MALTAAAALPPLFLLAAVAVKLTSSGPVLYWSGRVGRGNRIFRMPKFRSMRTDTLSVATHLLQYFVQWLTPIGSFMRKGSLDELPQLWDILKGNMSLVDPHPALLNQDDLIALRAETGVYKFVLTKWAQINERDELPIPQKVELGTKYL